ncbi:MAG: HAMP domain-containing protein [Deltaproteobacteria bacterium]|nr:HAMP domain-containing protein [Deltaproteobacteria bacterium]
MWRLRGIGTKLAVAVALSIGLAVTALALAIGRTARAHVAEEGEADARRLVESIWRTTRSAMLDERHSRIHRTIDLVANQGDIATIQLLDHQGIVRYSSDRRMEGRRREPSSPGCGDCHVKRRQAATPPPWTFDESGPRGRTLGVVRPIFSQPECQRAECHPTSQRVLGLLHVSVSLARHEATVLALRNRLIVFAVLFTLLTSVMVFLLAGRLVSRPVTELVEGTRRLASGDLDHPITVSSHDEIGELARSFNENTERLVRAQRQLLEMETLASLGRLAAGVAHEINNPLTGILSYAEGMRADLDSRAAQQRHDLDAIIGETIRCREIVQRLLAFARRRPVATQPTDLNALVEHVTRLLERQAALSKVALVQRLGPDLPLVPLDVNQFHQVIVNLVINAAEAMPEGGVITVETALVDKTTVVLRVADTGPGVPPELRARLLEPFFTTKPTGTGLGLAVAWGIIQQHQGRLSFTTDLGQGTTFIIELPIGEGAGAGGGERQLTARP